MKSALYEITAGRTDYRELSRRAERSGDHELAEFFLKVQRENTQHVREAERLLAARVAE